MQNELRTPLPTNEERRAAGRGLRERVKRGDLGRWEPRKERPDPIDLIEEAHAGRLDHLIPVRIGRMVASPYAFLRGAAALMAEDFSILPRTGLEPVICGDAHLGNLFVDEGSQVDGIGRTGFLDWAMVAASPGLRDVAYVLCGSIPRETRRKVERAAIERYCDIVNADGPRIDVDTAWDQYRLFAVNAWVAGAATLAMGSKWQPVRIGLGGTVRATEAIEDLDTIGLLESWLG